MDSRLARMLKRGDSYAEISKVVGITPPSISYHAKKLGLSRGRGYPNKVNWDKVKVYYESGHSVRDCMLRFGFSSGAWTKAVHREILQPRRAAPLLEYLTENSKGSRGSVKIRLIKEGFLENKCKLCGIGPSWKNKPLTLVLDHSNGVNDDYRIENLRLLCPNCNSQTETFSGRNMKRTRIHSQIV